MLILAEEMKTQGSIDETSRVVLIRALKRLKKLREEEVAKESLEDTQDMKKQQEDDMCIELESHMTSWDPERGKTNAFSTKNLAIDP